MRKDIGAIISLLDEQLGLYERMLELSQEQIKDISNTQKLNEILSQKAGLVKAIENIDAKLSAFKEQWNRDKSVFGQEERSILSSKIDRITSVLHELLSIEQRSIALAKDQQGKNSKEINKANIGKKALGMYKKRPMDRASKFMDKRG